MPDDADDADASSELATSATDESEILSGTVDFPDRPAGPPG